MAIPVQFWITIFCTIRGKFHGTQYAHHLTESKCLFPDIINTRQMGMQKCKVEATSVITLRIRWAVQKANMENE
jgi:hypothetical protein